MEEEGRLRDQILRALRGSLMVRIASLGATFVVSIVLARLLGSSQFGIYSYVFSLVTIMALPSQVGLPTLLVRETAKFQASGSWEAMKGLWLWSTRIIAVTSSSAVAIASAYIGLAWEEMSQDLRWTIIVGMALVPLIALGNARGAVLRGLRHVVAGQLPEGVIRPVLLVIFVAAAASVAGSVSAASAMAWHVLAAALAFAYGAWMLHRVAPGQVRLSTPDTTSSPVWRAAILPLGLITGLQVVSNQTGILLLGWLQDPDNVGYYKVATSGASLALFGLQTTTIILSPYLARAHTRGDRRGLERIASVGALIGTGAALPLLLGFWLAGEWILEIVYGADFVDAYWPLVIVCTGQAVNAMFGSVGALLSMTGREASAVRWLTLSTAVNVVLGIAMVPSLGAIGAALAFAVSMVVWNVGFWLDARKHLGVDGSIFSFVRGRVRQ